ncbi:MAG: hypothetical protein LUD02_01620 [Tannerellaceae bacterium]|nr:hypothetical protein [Tannerellaceae bacterium]MCD8262997.1 hypothetical protein [Tannerellaceae bacterium]
MEDLAISSSYQVSKDGKLIVLRYNGSFHPSIYKVDNDSFIKLPDLNPLLTQSGIVQIADDSSKLFVRYSGSNFFDVYIWNGNKFKRLPDSILAASGLNQSLILNTDGSKVLFGNSSTPYTIDVYEWDGETFAKGTPLDNLRINHGTAAFTPDGKRIILSNNNDLFMYEWNGTNYVKTKIDELSNVNYRLHISSNGMILILGNGLIYDWNGSTYVRSPYNLTLLDRVDGMTADGLLIIGYKALSTVKIGSRSNKQYSSGLWSSNSSTAPSCTISSDAELVTFDRRIFRPIKEYSKNKFEKLYPTQSIFISQENKRKGEPLKCYEMPLM